MPDNTIDLSKIKDPSVQNELRAAVATMAVVRNVGQLLDESLIPGRLAHIKLEADRWLRNIEENAAKRVKEIAPMPTNKKGKKNGQA